MARLIRQQVYLPAQLYQEITMRAKRHGTSVARSIRELLHAGLAAYYQEIDPNEDLRTLRALHKRLAYPLDAEEYTDKEEGTR